MLHSKNAHMFSFFKKAPPAPVPPSPEVPTPGVAAPTPTAADTSAAPPTAEGRQGWLARLRAGLGKTAKGISSVFGGSRIDEALFEDLEAALLMADAGVAATETLIAALRRNAKDTQAETPPQLKALLVDGLTQLLLPLQKPLSLGAQTPTVIMVAGVNGAGKTTSIGKLTHRLADEGATVLLAAADTFRAAAIDQLQIWGERSGVPVIAGAPNSDPGAVVYDAVQASFNRKADLLIVDTAGRLHTKHNLMQELKKLRNVVSRSVHDAPHQTLLVIDATNGQNAINQAKGFAEAVGVTGVILTKLDGTPKGGVTFAIVNELGIPIRYIGTGEKAGDLQEFDPVAFVANLFDDPHETPGSKE